MVKALVDNSNKTLKDLKEEIVDIDEILSFVKEIVEECKTIKDLKKNYPDKITKLEEALRDYTGENDLKLIKTEFPDKWKYITKKFAKPYEYFNSIDDYQKPVENLMKEDFFSDLKNGYPSHEEIERIMGLIKKNQF